MGTTIRRQPITTPIPASPNYKFLNITSFGGIQKSSNPFVVSSNTASDCLNVYVDEDNALSTRPRLQLKYDLKNAAGISGEYELIAVYALHDGYLLHCFVDAVAKLYKFRETELGLETPEEITGDAVPENDCEVFEQNDVIYLLGHGLYKQIKNNTISDVEAYVPLITVGKNKRTLVKGDDGVTKYEYDTEGSSFESPNIIGNLCRENYFWDGSVGSIPKKENTSDVVINTDYVELKHEQWRDKKVIRVYKDFVLLMDSNKTHPNVYCATITASGQVLSFEQIDNMLPDFDPTTMFYATDEEQGCFIICDVVNRVNHVWLYDKEKGHLFKQTIIQDDSFSRGPTENDVVKHTSITSDAGFYNVFYEYASEPHKQTVVTTRIVLGSAGVTLAYFMNPGASSSSYPDGIRITSVYAKKFTTKIGYYFLFLMTAYAFKPDETLLVYGLCLSEVPYIPGATFGILYSKDGVSNFTPDSIDVDWDNLSMDFINGNEYCKLQFEVSVDTGAEEDVNPYSVSLKDTTEYKLPYILSDVTTVRSVGDVYYAVAKSSEFDANNYRVLLLDSIENPSNVRDFELQTNTISTFSVNEYAIDGMDSQRVFKYVGSEEQPSFEVTKYLSSVKYDTKQIEDLREIFKKSKITERFDNNRWLASSNMVFQTALNNPAYIPVSGYNELGEDCDEITGLSIVNDNVLSAYKRNGIYIITPIVIDNALTYSYTETKNVIGNDAVNAPILTILTEMPVIVSYDGIYALNQLENVQSSDRITTLISEPINPLWLKEGKSDIDGCLTINRLYWTYFILPHEQSKGAVASYTKVYVLDNRTQQWYYWELPVLCSNVFVKTDKTHIVDGLGNVYTLETSDLLSEGNSEMTVYYDEINGEKSIIPWHWVSQILSLSTINYSKRLVDTTFILTDTDTQDEYALDYSFKAWRKSVSETNATTIKSNIYYVQSTTQRTMIPRFNFVQFTLKNTPDDVDNNKLKLVGLGLKYVLLEGLY